MACDGKAGGHSDAGGRREAHASRLAVPADHHVLRSGQRSGPHFDNLERAVAAAQQAGETGPLVDGVALVQSQFLDLLKRYGVIPIDALGKPFDPNMHQAVMQQPAKDQPPNTVVQVIERGFMNQDRVLRPAKVVVSK